MENHQLSIMISGLSIFVVIISVIVPSIYAEIDDKDSKDLCEDNGGDWKDGQCDFKANGEDKADAYGDDYNDLRAFENEKAALEDDLCEEPNAKFDICNPTGRDDKFADDDDNDNKDNNGDKIKVVNKNDDEGDDEYHKFKFKQGENEVTTYYKDEDDAKKAYEDLEKDELPHSDKSFNDWEYDDEEHPALR